MKSLARTSLAPLISALKGSKRHFVAVVLKAVLGRFRSPIYASPRQVWLGLRIGFAAPTLARSYLPAPAKKASQGAGTRLLLCSPLGRPASFLVLFGSAPLRPIFRKSVMVRCLFARTSLVPIAPHLGLLSRVGRKLFSFVSVGWRLVQEKGKGLKEENQRNKMPLAFH